MPVKLIELSCHAKSDYAIICCPHAGGAPNQYKCFAQYLPATFDLLGVLLPGREGWYNALSPVSLYEVAQDLVSIIKKLDYRKVILFGHSMGALIAYETARYLEGSLVHLIVSGHVAPHIHLPNLMRHKLDDKELINIMMNLSGTSKEVLENEELMELILPSIRQDFMLCDTYHFQENEPKLLKLPITALGGVDDSRMHKEGMQAWSEYTAINFQYYQYTGNHFFIFDHVFSITQQMVQRILREFDYV